MITQKSLHKEDEISKMIGKIRIYEKSLFEKDLAQEVKVAIVRKYEPMIRNLINSIPHDKSLDQDLMQEGRLIVLECIDKYDSSYNASFTTYLYVQLRGGLQKYVARNHDVYVSPSVLKRRKELEMFMNNNHTADKNEIAESLKMKKVSIQRFLNAPIQKYDAFAKDDETYYPLDRFSYSDDFDDISSDLCELAKRVLEERFDDFEKELLSYQFDFNTGIVRSDKEVAIVFGVPKNRVASLRQAFTNILRQTFLEGGDLQR
ncbi:MAG: sigma factor [Nitrososphaeria archaeon]